MKRPRVTVAAGLAGVLALTVLPLLVGDAGQGILVRMLIAALFACGFTLLAGQMGLMSFGHAAFYGIGAFACLHLMVWSEGRGGGWPTPLLPLAGAAAGALAAAVAGYFAARRSGSYFTLITLAMAELLHVVATQWHAVFGGEAGVTSMRQPWLGMHFDSALSVYYCTLAWTVLGIALAWLFTRTAFGRLTLAIRENEERARFLGYDVHTSKVLVFTLSGALSGVAGSLLAMANESASYTLFSPFVSLEVVMHTFIGGTGLFLGPPLAASLLTWLPFSLSSLTRLWPLYQGVLFMLLMLYAPGGFAALLRGHAARSAPFGAGAWGAMLLMLGGLVLMMVGFVGAAELTHRSADGMVQAGWAQAVFESLGLAEAARPALQLRIVAWSLAALLLAAAWWMLRAGLRARHASQEQGEA